MLGLSLRLGSDSGLDIELREKTVWSIGRATPSPWHACIDQSKVITKLYTESSFTQTVGTCSLQTSLQCILQTLTFSTWILCSTYPLISHVIFFFSSVVCNMPDSFQSWFLIAQLHLWLCMVRLKREGKDGDYLIKQVVSMFWYDVEQRMNVLGVSGSSI